MVLSNIKVYVYTMGSFFPTSLCADVQDNSINVTSQSRGEETITHYNPITSCGYYILLLIYLIFPYVELSFVNIHYWLYFGSVAFEYILYKPFWLMQEPRRLKLNLRIPVAKKYIYINLYEKGKKVSTALSSYFPFLPTSLVYMIKED